VARGTLNTADVVRAAADLADKEGFDAVTPSRLARHLGIRTPSLYSHVGGAADLRLRVAALALDESANRLRTALAGLSRGMAVAAWADGWREFARAHPGRYTATRLPLDGHAAMLDGSPAAAMLAAGRRHAEILRSVVADYGLDGDAGTHAVRLLGSVVHGFVSLELSGSFAHSEPGAAESWRHALQILDQALAGDAPEGSTTQDRDAGRLEQNSDREGAQPG